MLDINNVVISDMWDMEPDDYSDFRYKTAIEVEKWNDQGTLVRKLIHLHAVYNRKDLFSIKKREQRNPFRFLLKINGGLHDATIYDFINCAIVEILFDIRQGTMNVDALTLLYSYINSGKLTKEECLKVYRNSFQYIKQEPKKKKGRNKKVKKYINVPGKKEILVAYQAHVEFKKDKLEGRILDDPDDPVEDQKETLIKTPIKRKTPNRIRQFTVSPWSEVTQEQYDAEMERDDLLLDVSSCNLFDSDDDVDISVIRPKLTKEQVVNKFKRFSSKGKEKALNLLKVKYKKDPVHFIVNRLLATHTPTEINSKIRELEIEVNKMQNNGS